MCACVFVYVCVRMCVCVFYVCVFVSAFPALSLGFIIFGEMFTYLTVFLNPTIEVVTFRLRGWCQECFLFSASILVGHECQDLFSPCDGTRVCVHRLDLGFYSHPKEFVENGVRTHVNSKGKVPSKERLRAMLHDTG